MGIGAAILMLAVAVVMGAAAQVIKNPRIQDPRTSYDWAITGIVSLVFGVVVGFLKPIGPQWDGLYVVPAIVGGVVWAIIAAAFLRYVGRGTPELG